MDLQTLQSVLTIGETVAVIFLWAYWTMAQY